MGTKSLDKDDWLWVESATPDTYNYVAGQGDLTITRNAEEIDTSSKDDSGYATGDFGLKSLEIALDVIPSLPDTNGFTRLQTLINASPQVAFKVQIRGKGVSGTSSDKIFEGLVKGVIGSTNSPRTGPRGVGIRLKAAAAPATDAIS